MACCNFEMEYEPSVHELQCIYSEKQVKLLIEDNKKVLKMLNTCLSLSPLKSVSKMNLEQLMIGTSGDVSCLANQAFNFHMFFKSIKCAKDNKGKQPSGRVMELIKNSFGSFNEFKSHFISLSDSMFGPGWCWLILDPVTCTLRILVLPNSGNPLRCVDPISVSNRRPREIDQLITPGGVVDPVMVETRHESVFGYEIFSRVNLGIPLMTCCLFENAYCLDFGVNRTEFVSKFLDCVNWEVVNEALECYVKRVQETRKILGA